MNEFRCETCLFCDVCPELGRCYPRSVCQNYAPGDEQSEDVALDIYIEADRAQYASEWRSYLSEE